MPFDTRGQRIYMVRDLPAGQIGGTEFHRIREEIIFALDGSVRLTCEDVFGNKEDYVLDGNYGIWLPPFIRHTYQVLEEQSGLLVLTNTLFIPDNPATHDTYTEADFRKLQEQYKT